MAKCLNCGCVFCYYGGSYGHPCPKCDSKNIDASMEIDYIEENNENETK